MDKKDVGGSKTPSEGPTAVAFTSCSMRQQALEDLSRSRSLSKDIQCSIILPVFTYCGVLQINLSETKVKNRLNFMSNASELTKMVKQEGRVSISNECEQDSSMENCERVH